MASETITETPPTTTTEMAVDSVNPCGEERETNGGKREREEDETAAESGNENDTVSKKQKVEDDAEEKENVGPVILGPKTFETSLEMFNYFYKLLHHWPINIPANKYEYMVLLDLIKKGHPEPDKKIGSGVNAFEIRHHPTFQSRCFFVIRDDKSVEDFSFRKCVDHILPLPENMKMNSDVNKGLSGNGGGKKGGGGGGGRGGRGGGRGRGWGGKSRR